MTVLIVAYDGYDADIKEVTEAIEARGARAIRFDTDALPTAVRLSLGYGREGGATLIAGSGAVDLTTISAVWLRGLQEGRALPEMDADQRRVCVEAAQVSLTGLLAELGGLQLDPQECVRRAEHKPLQLKVAQALGLPIPPTLISNDPDAVRAFARSCPEGLITKMVVSKFFRTDEAGEIESVYTNLVTPETLEDLRGLHLCPMIFQARVPKALELRVTVVGHQVFTAAVDSQIAAGGARRLAPGPRPPLRRLATLRAADGGRGEALAAARSLRSQLRGNRSHPDPGRAVCLPGG